MGEVAKGSPSTSLIPPRTVPPARAESGASRAFGPDVSRLPLTDPSTSRRLMRGVPLRTVLESPSLAGSVVLGGASGLDRPVARLNVMEVPDILPWVKPDELLLTTGYPLREDVAALPDLVNSLEARGVAALAVKLGRYLEEIPAAMVRRADELGFPVIRLPEHVAFDDVLDAVLTDVLDHQAAVLARSEEVHRALVATVLAGGGVPEVTHRLAELLSATVMITTPDGRILAQA
ncbi:MAG: PucR family transcriptional regulator ligand-binding domain-containing protein, partial [Actinomycetes bacterium]